MELLQRGNLARRAMKVRQKLNLKRMTLHLFRSSEKL